MRLATSVVLTIIATGFLFAKPALAAWESTTWDASPKETLAALGDTATPRKDKKEQRVWNQHPRITRPGTFGELSVLEEYYFRKGKKLSIVRLTPTDTRQCNAFAEHAQKTLGEPIDNSTAGDDILVMKRWDYADEPSGNVMLLSLVSIGKDAVLSCHLIYQPYGNGKPGRRD